MRVHSFSAAIALALPLALASAAHTAPISFMELHGTIAIDITTQTFGQSSGAAGASGHIDLDLTGDSLTVLGSHIDVGDITATGSGLFGTLLIDDVHTFLTSTTPATDSGGGVFDLAGWQLTLDHGTVFIPALGMTAFDFSTEPLSLALSTALSTLSLSGPNEFWDIPLSAVVTFWTLGNTVTVTVSGSLLLGVPEPSTLVLLGAGLGGLVMTRRRPGWGKRPAP